MEDMAATTQYLCSKIQGAKFGYTQSDEISIVLTDYETLNTDMWFDGQIQKVVSVAASMATARFNKLRTLRLLKEATTSNAIYLIDGMTEAEFDARAYTVPDQEEVVNYLIWRQQDATRNSISMAAQANFSHKELQGKSTNVMQDMLITQKNINWDKYPVPIKRGWSIHKRDVNWVRAQDNKEFAPYKLPADFSIKDLPQNCVIFLRTEWFIDPAMPIITKDRNYVLDKLPSFTRK
jgi:tRNA(His) 5'-end guanylyltransferase